MPEPQRAESPQERPSPAEPPIRLLWTVGFAGKRFLTAQEERAAEPAIDAVLAVLHRLAKAQEAELTALSSIARGADVVFSRVAQRASGDRPALPWKCLLPFDREEFFRLDMLPDGAQQALGRDPTAPRREMAEACLTMSSFGHPEIFPGPEAGADPEVAYLECGYRTVDECDVLVLLVREEQDIEPLMAAWKERIAIPSAETPARVPTPTGSVRAGSLPMALYAAASRRPMIVLNVEAGLASVDVEAALERALERVCRGQEEPDPEIPPVQILMRCSQGELFFDPSMTAVFRSAMASHEDRDAVRPVGPDGGLSRVIDVVVDGIGLGVDWLLDRLGPRMSGGKDSKPQRPEPVSLRHRTVREAGDRLGRWANVLRDQVERILRRTIRLHLLASILAVLVALAPITRLLEARPNAAAAVMLVVLAISIAKPVLVMSALWATRRLERSKHREQWVMARVLEQLCCSADALWPLPGQPLGAFDEESFPPIRRLLRTLRLIREMDHCRPAGPGATWRTGETAESAQLREACTSYAETRLEHQRLYYQLHATPAKTLNVNWMSCFYWAAGVTVVAGVLLGVLHSGEYFDALKEIEGRGHGAELVGRALLFLVIVAPIYAAYSLSMMSISDSRRRAERYEEMAHTLGRLREALLSAEANPSRRRIIKQAERLLLEEQHEWFSVTRNLNV